MLSPKENLLEAISFGKPDYVPMDCEGVWWGFQFEGNYRSEDWTDPWGVGWKVSLEKTVPFPVSYPLETLDRLGDYAFPDPDDLVFTAKQKEALEGVDRGERLVSGQLTYLLFERAWAIMGMDNFLMALITHPSEAHEFLHAIADYDRRVFDRYLELGVDAVSGTEDLGSQRALMISPRMFREFFLPEYEHMFENVLAAGKMVVFHSCGCVEEIVGDLAQVGVTILNPIQARANDLGRIKAETVGKMALAGAIDTAILLAGTPEQVRAEVRRVMDILKPGAGYICRPDQYVPGFPEENMDALWETAREVGGY